MSDRRREQSTPPPIDSDALARHTFSSSFRGYDIDEVRAYLLALAEDVRAINEHTSWLAVELAEAERRATAHVELDENRLTELLGEETAGCWRRLVRPRRRFGPVPRPRPTVWCRRRTSKPSAIRTEALSDAIRHRERAETAALAEVEAAKAHGRQLITDAQALRERVLADLTRRRDAGRAQIAHLKEGRDRLLGAYEIVRRTLEQAVDELRAAAPEARAIDVAAQAVALSPPAPVDDETEGIRILTPPAPEPEAEPDAEVVVVVEQVVVDDVVVEEVVAVAVVEEVTDEVTEESPVIPSDPTLDESVDDLFARIRAACADEVAKAEEVLAEPEAEPAADSLGESGSLSPESATETSPVEPAADDAEPAVDVFEQRAEALVPIEASLTRKLRRALADEQNEVLDGLRRLKGVPSVAALLPERATHDERFAAVLGAAVGRCRPGRRCRSRVATGGTAVSRWLPSSPRSLVGDLRARAGRAVEEAGGDVETLAEAVSATYREWKTARAEPLAATPSPPATPPGSYAAPSGTLRWVVDPAEGGCPDCDDNALAGATPRGQAFPTGSCTRRPTPAAAARCDGLLTRVPRLSRCACRPTCRAVAATERRVRGAGSASSSSPSPSSSCSRRCAASPASTPTTSGSTPSACAACSPASSGPRSPWRSIFTGRVLRPAVGQPAHRRPPRAAVPPAGPEEELLERYHELVGDRTGLVRVGVAAPVRPHRRRRRVGPVERLDPVHATRRLRRRRPAVRHRHRLLRLPAAVPDLRRRLAVRRARHHPHRHRRRPLPQRRHPGAGAGAAGHAAGEGPPVGAARRPRRS